jgi:hypothetical protein
MLAMEEIPRETIEVMYNQQFSTFAKDFNEELDKLVNIPDKVSQVRKVLQKFLNYSMEDDEQTRKREKNETMKQISQSTRQKRKKETSIADAQPIKTEKKEPPKEITQPVPCKRKKETPVCRCSQQKGKNNQCPRLVRRSSESIWSDNILCSRGCWRWKLPLSLSIPR